MHVWEDFAMKCKHLGGGATEFHKYNWTMFYIQLLNLILRE